MIRGNNDHAIAKVMVDATRRSKSRDVMGQGKPLHGDGGEK